MDVNDFILLIKKNKNKHTCISPQLHNLWCVSKDSNTHQRLNDLFVFMIVFPVNVAHQRFDNLPKTFTPAVAPKQPSRA